MASNIDLFFNTSRNKRTFPEVLAEIQEYLASKYSTLITDNPEEQHQQITAYIAKYLNDYSLGVEGMSHEELIDKLYTEMAEFSFLTPYLFANDVEEININSWKDVKITYADGRVVPTKDRFQTPQHAVDVIRRLLHKSGMILDNSQPGVVGHLSNKIRITVLGNPLTDKEKGVAASIRIVNPKKLSRDDFIGYGTATAEMLDFLAEVLRFGLSICVTGSTGSGKTTLMSWILSTIPNEKRIFTIENGCREFDLVKEDAEGNVINNVVHTVTRFSDDPKQNYDQERLLEFALTCNPDIVCVGEMKSAEAFAAQEAARTGHAVITTTHANSCKATYYRMVTLCTQKYDMGDKTLYNLVTEAFPIVLFVKKLEDNSRRVMEITECEILEDGTRQLHTLYPRWQGKGAWRVSKGIHDLGQPAKAAFGKRYAAPSAGAYRWWRCKTGYWKGGNCVIVLILLAFVGMLTGIFLILGMTPFTFAEELTKPLSGRRQPISKRIQQVNHPKEPKGIRKTVLEAREMLILTGKGGKFAAICAFSLFLAAMGAVICIVIQNYFMLPVLAVGMGLLPFWYVLFTSHSYKKLMNNEIETGLSIITSSYLRSESMITAVEENIHYLNPPVADVFRGFLAETNMISADVKQALSNMKPKLDNYVFREWVDAAIACQDDKSLKSTLTPIIGKLSDMRIVAAELDYLLYEPFKEFITMAFLLIGNIPLLYFLNKDWYDVLVNTGFGKGILAVCLLVLLISFAAVIRLTKPVEYKR